MTEPYKLRGKAEAQVRAASMALQQAEGVLRSIAETLKEAQDLPDDWQFAQKEDGIYLISVAPPVNAIDQPRDELNDAP